MRGRNTFAHAQDVCLFFLFFSLREGVREAYNMNGTMITRSRCLHGTGNFFFMNVRADLQQDVFLLSCSIALDMFSFFFFLIGPFQQNARFTITGLSELTRKHLETWVGCELFFTRVLCTRCLAFIEGLYPPPPPPPLHREARK